MWMTRRRASPCTKSRCGICGKRQTADYNQYRQTNFNMLPRLPQFFDLGRLGCWLVKRWAIGPTGPV